MNPMMLMMIGNALSTGISAAGQMAAGESARKTGEFNFFGKMTEREVSKVETLANHNARARLYKDNLKSTIAAFSVGRDVSTINDKNLGPDSVGAFLKRNKDIVSEDLRASDLMGAFKSSQLAQEARVYRIEGRAKKEAATIGAMTAIAGGIFRHGQIKAT